MKEMKNYRVDGVLCAGQKGKSITWSYEIRAENPETARRSVEHYVRACYPGVRGICARRVKEVADVVGVFPEGEGAA